MTCPQCGFALIAWLGHPTCTMGCGYDGPRREPTAEERKPGRRLVGAQLRKRRTK